MQCCPCKCPGAGHVVARLTFSKTRPAVHLGVGVTRCKSERAGSALCFHSRLSCSWASVFRNLRICFLASSKRPAKVLIGILVTLLDGLERTDSALMVESTLLGLFKYFSAMFLVSVIQMLQTFL